MGTNPDRPYRDEEWLHEKYVEENRTKTEIAKMCGAGRRTIYDWAEKFGLERPYKDPEWLREKYVGEGMSQSKMADEVGVSGTCIGYWMDKYDIETHHGEMTSNNFYTRTVNGKSAYEFVDVHEDGGTTSVRVHRLLAVAEYGVEAVKGSHVHHINNLSWDNRADNIVPLPPGLHTKVHHRIEKPPYPVPADIEEELKEMGVDV